MQLSDEVTEILFIAWRVENSLSGVLSLESRCRILVRDLGPKTGSLMEPDLIHWSIIQWIDREFGPLLATVITLPARACARGLGHRIHVGAHRMIPQLPGIQMFGRVIP